MPQVFPNPLLQDASTRFVERAAGSAASPRRMQPPRAIRFWHLTSMDAPTVAVAWALAFAWAARAILPWWIPVLLAMAAWVIYVADRLLDARRALRLGRTDGLRERHFFHWRHRRILATMAAAAALVAGAIALSLLPQAARERGSVLAAAAMVYLSRVHFVDAAANLNGRRLRIRSPQLRVCVPKELLVGVLFTAACVLPAWNRTAVRSWEFAAAALFFAALAWLNCHAIDLWEARAEDAARRTIAVPAGLLGLAGALIALIAAPVQSRWAALLAAGALAALLLNLLGRVRGRLTPLALRAAADLALLTPLALLLWR